MGKDAQDPSNKRKRLLVASLGVATVSYLGMQAGCADGEEYMTTISNLIAPPGDASFYPWPGSDAAVDAALGTDAQPPEAGGQDAALRDAAPDAIVTSGNLLPPPDAATDAATQDASRAKDAQIDTGLPASGNLMPMPPRESR